MGTLWNGNKGGTGLDPDIDRFLSSLPVDSRLLPEDLLCSAAHARMLGDRGILPQADARAIIGTLEEMRREALAGRIACDPESEDVHSFIEEELTRRLGDIGKAVHAGRSRNDQVAVALRLHLLNAFDATAAAASGAIRALLELARDHTDTIFPGYTHLQRAQPVSFAHHLLAWCAALERDAGRLADARHRADECPLGSGALAGSGLPTDREATAKALGFERPSRNTMDAVADRDACVEYAAACATLAMHLSRFCEDIALWASTEYGFVKIDDSASTGSSIMPQKRNPDPAELLRGKSARIFGDLQGLLVLQKGLPYAYNRDLQEDKAFVFEVEDTILGSLAAFGALVRAIHPDVEKMRAALEDGYLEATDLAEYFVDLGIPFRNAYRAAKELVGRCVATGRRLGALEASDIASAFPDGPPQGFDLAALKAYLDPRSCVERRTQTGGPSPERTREEIARLAAKFAKPQRK